MQNAADGTGDLLYFNPTMFADYRTNPFKQKERSYPVDMPYKQSKQLLVTLKLPNGYTVSELPQNTKLVLPDNDASFQYIISNNNSVVQVSVKLNINRLEYAAENYKSLKLFFDQVAAKLNEPIVLKKK